MFWNPQNILPNMNILINLTNYMLNHWGFTFPTQLAHPQLSFVHCVIIICRDKADVVMVAIQHLKVVTMVRQPHVKEKLKVVALMQ